MNKCWRHWKRLSILYNQQVYKYSTGFFQCQHFKYQNASSAYLKSSSLIRGHMPTRHISFTGHLSQSDDLTKDPEVKSLLKEIHDDFSIKPEEKEIFSSFQGNSDSSSDSDSSSSDSSDSDSDELVNEQLHKQVKKDQTIDQNFKTSQSDTKDEGEYDYIIFEDEDDSENRTMDPAMKTSNNKQQTNAKKQDDYDYITFEEGDIILDDSHENLIEEQPLPIELNRGKTGVFDIEEMTTLLRSENLDDICVIKVPDHYQFVDYMVIASGRSTRHLRACAEMIKWVFKRKRSKRDPETCFIEGLNAKDWMAIDLGNIAVHLFLPRARDLYDLETLWTVGSQYDEKALQQTDDPFAMYINQGFDMTIPKELLQHTRPAEESVTYVDANDIHVMDRYNDKQNEDGQSMDSVAGWHDNPENKVVRNKDMPDN